MRPYAPLLIVLAIPLLLIVAVQQEQRANEHRLAAIASDIAGRDVDVHCPGLLSRLAEVSAHAGTVFFDERGRPADFTDLDEETCSELDRFAEGKTGQGEQAKVARALHVLAHESSHLAGVRDEAAADCYGHVATGVVGGQTNAQVIRGTLIGDLGTNIDHLGTRAADRHFDVSGVGAEAGAKDVDHVAHASLFRGD